tara:strand:- start:278 stop:646 length:369 start_codon:yes stop_codon:yes gene_type:complete
MYKSPFLDNRDYLFENSVGFVVYDKFPVTEGHCLVVSRRIYSDYFDSSHEEIVGLNDLLFKTKKFLDKKFKPSGYNVGINCKKAGGQTIEHLHIHLIPRYLDDVEDPAGGVRGVIPHKQKYQ